MLINLAFQFVENQNKIKLLKSDYKILSTNCYGDLKECVYKLSKKTTDKQLSDLELAKEAINSISPGETGLPDNILQKLVGLGSQNEKKI